MSAWSDAVSALSPVVWLKLDEASGTTAVNDGSATQNGTVAGTVTWNEPGLVPTDDGSSVTLGTNSMITVSGVNSPDVGTVAFTLRTDTQTPSTTNPYLAVIGTASTTQTALTVESNGDVRLRFRNASSGFAVWAGGWSVLSDGQPHLIVMRYITGAQSLWVDGVLRATGDQTAATVTHSTLYIKGRNIFSNYPWAMELDIDEVVSWDTALSDTDLDDLWAAWEGGGSPTTADVTLAGQAASASASFTLDVDALPADVTVSGSAPSASASFSITTEQDVTLAGSAPSASAAFTLALPGLPVDISLGGLAPSATAEFTLATVVTTIDITLAGSAPAASASFTLDTPQIPGADTDDQSNGLILNGYATHSWEPFVVPPPPPIVLAEFVDLAVAHSSVAISGTEVSYETTTYSAPRHRDRVLIGGVDFTYFRGIRTPCPDYTLVEPLLYGPGSLSLPQVHPLFEKIGSGAATGELQRIQTGAPVIVQRVEGDDVVATDYRGFIVAIDVSGGALSLELAGQAQGRALLQEAPPPMFTRLRDIADHVKNALRSINVPVSENFVDDIGIRAFNRGGTDRHTHLLEFLGQAQRLSGTRFTVSPDDDGRYRLHQKDVTTIHGTVYFDGAGMLGDLREDMAEKPNRIYTRAITKDGLVLNGAVAPGLNRGRAPAYPHTGPFGVGTTDADTASGDGVTVLFRRLHHTGYMEFVPSADSTVYTQKLARAVKKLQRDAGLNDTGTMNEATWNSLYDLDATGYSLLDARILPAAQLPEVKRWHRTGTGAVRASNDRYQHGRVKVDRSIEMGSPFTASQRREWAEEELDESATPTWVGDISTGGEGSPALAFVAGDHTPGDPVTGLLRARALRPGMNLRAPLFQGGQTLHVSSVTVSGDGMSVSATVDTRARDAMEVWEIIARNRETRKNPARLNIAERRRSAHLQDTFAEWVDWAGEVGDIDLSPGWNVFAIPVGQEGEIRSIRMRLAPARKFAVILTAQEPTRKRLATLIGNPLDAGGDEDWWEKQRVRDWLDKRGFFYAAGTKEEPCGYWPKRHTNENGDTTDAPITGVHRDDEGFTFYSLWQPVLWASVWVPEATTLRGDRVLRVNVNPTTG